MKENTMKREIDSLSVAKEIATALLEGDELSIPEIAVCIIKERFNSETGIVIWQAKDGGGWRVVASCLGEASKDMVVSALTDVLWQARNRWNASIERNHARAA